MNTLHDLRETLDRHAADVHDDAGVARTTAVRGRARAVRRRRATGVGAAAALAVAAVATVSVLPGDRDPRPADRELIGKVAPETVESLGYTYRFVEGVESEEFGWRGRQRATIRLGASELPRLVTWASDADEVVVDVSVEGYSTRSRATDFDDFVAMPAVESPTVRVRGADGAEDATALAVYELVPDERPAGITEGGLTFREQVGSEQLVDAAVGDVADPEITLEVEVPESERLRIAEFCEGVPVNGNLWVNVSVDDAGATSSGGCDDPAFDPAVGNASWLDPRHLPEPGETVRIRMWVSRGPSLRGEPVRLEDARLAFGVYDVGLPVAEVAGWDIPRLLEHGGHVWSFVTTEEATRGAGSATYTNTSTEMRLVEASLSGAGRRTAAFRAPHQGVDHRTATGNGSGMLAILRPGEQVSLTVRGEPEPTTRMGFAVYERVD